MTICPQCGYNNLDGVQQCVSCGTNLMASNYTQYGQSQQPQTGQWSGGNQYAGGPQQQPGAGPPGEKSKKNLLIIIVAVAIVFVVVCSIIVVAVILSTGDSTPSDRDGPNILDDDDDDDDDDFDYTAYVQSTFDAPTVKDVDPITEDTVWDKDITLENSVFVDEDAELTIDPGVTVTIDYKAHIFILGGLKAPGTENEQISFRSSDGENSLSDFMIYFKGLKSSTEATLSYCHFEYCTILYSNCQGLSISNCELIDSTISCQDYSSIDIKYNDFNKSNVMCYDGSTPTIDGNSFTSETRWAISAIYLRENCNGTASNNEIVGYDEGIFCNKGFPEIKNNIISECTNGIRIWDCNPKINHNTILNCSEWALDALGEENVNAENNYWGTIYDTEIKTLIHGSGVDYDPCLDEDGNSIEPELLPEEKPIQVWEEDVTLTDTYTVEEDKTLVIKAGVTVTISGYRGIKIYVKGSLQIEGEKGNMVTITEAPGSSNWQGIRLSEKSHDNKIEYCIIENVEGTAIGIYDSGTPLISNCIIRNVTEEGIFCASTSTPTIKHNEITGTGFEAAIYSIGSSPIIQYNHIHNNSRGISCTTSATGQESAPTIDHNSIVDNENTAISNGDDSTWIIAKNNFWGSNDDYTISKMFHGNVDYDPWLESSPV